MSLRALILIAAFGLTAANASGQFRSLLFFEGDVLSLSGTQIYLDFGTPIVGVVPPLIPNAGDIVVIVPPPVDAKTSTSFSLAVAQAINAGFRQRPDTFTGYLAEGRTEPGKDDKENDGTITINSPSVLRGAFASGGSGLPPSTKVTSSTGVAYNPTIRDLSPFLTNAHPGTPNAQFLINGVSTGEDELHLVEIPISSTMTLSFDSGSNVNQGVTLLASSEYFPSAIPSSVVPWGGSLDLGHPAPGGIPVSGVSVVVDGINGMVSPFIAPLFRTSLAGRLDVSFTISPGAVGTRLVLQALMSDPPNAPFHLNFTQAADINFAFGQSQVLNTGSDGFAVVDFGPGVVEKSFEFYGTTYSQAFVYANGYVTLGAPSSLPVPFVFDPVQALGAEPTIFANFADWDPGTAGVRYEDFGARARIQWGSTTNPIQRQGGGAQGIFGVTLNLSTDPTEVPPSQSQLRDLPLGDLAQNPGSIFLDYALLQGAAPGALDSLIGISPGLVATGAQSLDLQRGVSGAPVLSPLVSLNDRAGLALSTLPANGGVQAYHNGQSLRTAQLAFHPIDAATAPRYDVASIDTKADDLTAVQPTTLMTASPVPFQSLTLVGQFEFLFASGPAVTMPLVELTSPGQTPIPTMIQTVFTTGNLPAGAAAMTLQPPPGFREWEGVVVAVPTASLAGLMPGSSLGLQVTFANGVVRTLPAAITLM